MQTLSDLGLCGTTPARPSGEDAALWVRARTIAADYRARLDAEAAIIAAPVLAVEQTVRTAPAVDRGDVVEVAPGEYIQRRPDGSIECNGFAAVALNLRRRKLAYADALDASTREVR
ncbi:hypothetical protein [Actinoallomurus sp. CA-150999]|uniref:hypothetical protein n=1 Tax=Actinoallomurus sp. CA-150999 TaxID=3239887 RepID=UPI003D94B898